MSGAVTLSKFNPSKRAQAPHKVMGSDGRFYFKGRRVANGRHLKSTAQRTKRIKPKPYVSNGRPQYFQKGHPSFKKGFTSTYKLQDLIVAIKQVEEETGEDLLVHFVRKSFKNDPVLKDLMKKLLPDLKHVEADIDVTEQFQLIIDATGDDDDDDFVDAQVVPQRQLIARKTRRVKLERRKRA